MMGKSLPELLDYRFVMAKRWTNNWLENISEAVA